MDIPPSNSVDIQNTEVSQQSVDVHNEEIDMSEALEVEASNRIHVEEVEDFDIEINSLVAYYDDRNSPRPCLGNVMAVCMEDVSIGCIYTYYKVLTISNGNLLTMVLVKIVNL